MTDGDYKETAPQNIESLENLGLPPLVSQIILFSDFVPNLDIQCDKEQGSWRIETWTSRDGTPTILISKDRELIGYEVNIVEEQNGLQKREIINVKMGNGVRTKLDLVEVLTEDLLELETILSSGQNPTDPQP